MGLDISVYINLKEVPSHEVEVDSDGYPVDWDKFQKFYVNPHFEGRAEPIREDVFYTFDTTEIDPGWSYSGYGRHRRTLAELISQNIEDIWAEEFTTCPFYELINFSDCEGIIGSVVSAKLAKDFAEYQYRADAHQDAYFREFYNEMRKAFEAAANNNGVVVFH
jgi:hypothetical protein